MFDTRWSARMFRFCREKSGQSPARAPHEQVNGEVDVAENSRRIGNSWHQFERLRAFSELLSRFGFEFGLRGNPRFEFFPRDLIYIENSNCFVLPSWPQLPNTCSYMRKPHTRFYTRANHAHVLKNVNHTTHSRTCANPHGHTRVRCRFGHGKRVCSSTQCADTCMLTCVHTNIYTHAYLFALRVAPITASCLQGSQTLTHR